MADELNRDLGRLEGKVDALLTAFSEERDATKGYRESVQRDVAAALQRITILEKVHDRIKWTVGGVMLAGSFIGAVVSLLGTKIWALIFSS